MGHSKHYKDRSNVLLKYLFIILLSFIFSLSNVDAAGREGADSENDDERIVWAILTMFYIFMVPTIDP
jgi:hypothetical protein